MSGVTSKLSHDQEKTLLSFFDHVKLHLLYKSSIHGYNAAAFHSRCDKQGPTVIVAYNASGFVFGAYTSKDYAQSGGSITDEEAFLYSFKDDGCKLKVPVIRGQGAFTDGATGPNYGALVFLDGDTPAIQSNPGTGFNFQPAQMHGGDLALTEFEVYRVEALKGLLDTPWRTVQWTDERKQKLKMEILNYQPEIKTVNQARVLLVGSVGAGKSSFFNSVNSTFRGNITSQAIAGTAGKSVTTQFRTYTIKDGKGGQMIPLMLCDTMGLEESTDAGLDLDDITNICKGHMQDRYKFSPSAPLVEGAPGFKKNAKLNDKIHCVVYVVDTCKVSLMSQKMLDKFRPIQKKVQQLGIPQVLLMTKIDVACPLVGKDVKNVYHSVYIQKKAEELSGSLGIPLSCVLPVKNYSKEVELDLCTDILLFSALQMMLNYADNFFDNQDVEDDVDAESELYRCN